MLALPERVEITGPATERYVEVLSPRALELLVRLHDTLADRRAEALMEDAATAEISRSQVWQWIHNDVMLDDGPLVTKDVVESMIEEELGKIQRLVGKSFDTARYGQAVALFTEVALADSFAEFLTLPAYERMP